jgi:hypothetical protein
MSLINSKQNTFKYVGYMYSNPLIMLDIQFYLDLVRPPFLWDNNKSVVTLASLGCKG